MRTEVVYLHSILEAIEQIESYTSVGHELFMETRYWQDSVVLRMINIGEAVKNLSPETRARQRHIPWRRIAGLRDILVHDYMDINLESVWSISQDELPDLKKAVEELLAFG